MNHTAVIRIFLFILSLKLCTSLSAHPIPDIPVRATFKADGMVTIQVEVDPRCFVDDALNEPYFENSEMPSISKQEQERLFSEANVFILKNVDFWANPIGRISPQFSMRFTSFNGEKLAANPKEDDTTPVMITAKWETNASVWKDYWINNPKTCRFSLQFINTVQGEEQPLNVLFPGEESYMLELSHKP